MKNFQLLYGQQDDNFLYTMTQKVSKLVSRAKLFLVLENLSIQSIGSLQVVQRAHLSFSCVIKHSLMNYLTLLLS
jgi:hypothetical protein